MMRFRLVLLDANVVIQLFELGAWQQVAERCEILLSRTVIDEAHFYERDGERFDIDWDELTKDSSIQIRSVSPNDVQAYCKRFDKDYYDKMDPGEAESLVLLEREAEARICSADKIVWRVLGNINQPERGISLEEILQQIGLTKPLPDRFSKRFREQWCRQGSQDHFLGKGDRKRHR